MPLVYVISAIVIKMFCIKNVSTENCVFVQIYMYMFVKISFRVLWSSWRNPDMFDAWNTNSIALLWLLSIILIVIKPCYIQFVLLKEVIAVKRIWTSKSSIITLSQNNSTYNEQEAQGPERSVWSLVRLEQVRFMPNSYMYVALAM